MSELSGKQLAIECAKAADEIKAEDIQVFDLRGLSTLTDYMIVCSGMSMPHLKAVLKGISSTLLEKHDVKPTYTDGNTDAKWVVLDFVDVMIHVMHEEMRELYGLEDLWGDAEVVEWSV